MGNGNFVKATIPAVKPNVEAGSEEKPDEDAKHDVQNREEKKKDDKKPKKQESAGISKAERDELEKLKDDIIARKKELKDSGMSGGQINKDEQVVSWVNRMNELKEKESPGSTAKPDAGKDKKEAKSL